MPSEHRQKLDELITEERPLILTHHHRIKPTIRIRDTEQVLPLLPGAPACVVLVTSRHRLTGLVTTHGAHLLCVDVIDDAATREVLAGHFGHERLAAELAAVAELVDACGGLPLAIGIVAARAAGYPKLPLRVLADDLMTTRLAALDAGEPSANLSAVFELLAMAPGPDIGLLAATALAGRPVAQVSAELRVLAHAHLVGPTTPDRYRMHDLVRLHAAAEGERHQSEEDRRAAFGRLVEHYLHTAYAAERVLQPHRPAIALAPPGADCRPEPNRCPTRRRRSPGSTGSTRTSSPPSGSRWTTAGRGRSGSSRGHCSRSTPGEVSCTTGSPCGGRRWPPPGYSGTGPPRPSHTAISVTAAPKRAGARKHWNNSGSPSLSPRPREIRPASTTHSPGPGSSVPTTSARCDTPRTHSASTRPPATRPATP